MTPRSSAGRRVRCATDGGALAALDAAGDEPLAGLLQAVVTSGFQTAQVDPRGFRSGSMNELLGTPERYR